MRIVDDYNIGTFAGGRATYRGRDAATGTTVFEPALLVLIWAQLVDMAPKLLVPLRFNEAS